MKRQIEKCARRVLSFSRWVVHAFFEFLTSTLFVLSRFKVSTACWQEKEAKEKAEKEAREKETKKVQQELAAIA